MEPKFHYKDKVRIVDGGFYDQELAYVKSWRSHCKDIAAPSLGRYITYEVELLENGDFLTTKGDITITMPEGSLVLERTRLNSLGRKSINC